MTEEEKAKIDALSREELAYKWRFGDSEFWASAAGRYASERFWHKLGGFTPEISKRVGWGETVDD